MTQTKSTAKKTTAKKTQAKKTTSPARKLDGDTPLENLAPAEQEAFLLSEAAILMDNARGNSKDKRELAEALEKNLELWSAIRAMVERWTDEAQAETKKNIARLGDFVTGSIVKAGTDIAESTLEVLININLQIAEGLLEGYNRQRIQDHAYFLWENEGKQPGKEDEYWARAEKEILGA